MIGMLKGWFGEIGARVGMWLELDKETYPRIHNLIIPASGGTTQIDHVLVSIYGVFVVETKTMKGWIFGDEKAPKWTQSIFGKKFSFQNPLHQNYRHARALAEFLNLPDELFHSVVFFIGDCEFKTPVPLNVLDRGLGRYIRSFVNPILTQTEVDEVFNKLSEQKHAPAASGWKHVANLKERHSGTSCPKCQSPLILRTAKKGVKAGGQFFGCSGYPKCRYTRPA